MDSPTAVVLGVVAFSLAGLGAWALLRDASPQARSSRPLTADEQDELDDFLSRRAAERLRQRRYTGDE